MKESDTDSREAQLLALLATMKVEATPEADFEERFLYHFHERVTQEIVCAPAHRRALDHILQALRNFGFGKIAFGSSALGIGALAIGLFTVPDVQEAHVADAPVAKGRHLESSLSSLAPALASDLAACTCVRISRAPKRYANTEGLMATHHATGDRQSNGYTSSMDKGWEAEFELPPYEETAEFSFAY